MSVSAQLPAVQDHEVRGDLTKHHELISWLRHNGGYFHPDIVVAYDVSKGYHALVSPGKTLVANTQIASCPIESTLCALNALDIEPFACRGVRFPQSFLDRYCHSPDVLQTFFLMENRILGDKSWWKHYISILPSSVDIEIMQYDAPEDRRWIAGTNLEGAIDIQLERWQHNFAEGLEQLKLAGWTNALNGLLSWDLYRWAATMFGTRSFTSQVLSDTKPGDLARSLGRDQPNQELLSKLFSERFAVLLPVLDILNHKPGAQIEWQSRHSSVGLQVLETYEQDQELYNNYGPRDNESLLLSYGFVLQNNPFEHVIVSIRVPPGSPLADARTWPADSRSNDHFNCYVFGPLHPIIQDGTNLERAFFSYDLLDSISVLVGNDRELQIMYNNQKTIMSSSLPSSFQDFRNILATLSQIMQDCRARIYRLRITDPTQIQPPALPQNSNQTNALIYRLSQVQILQNAIAACTFVLFRAATDLETDGILTAMQANSPAFYSDTLKNFVGRLPCLTRAGELVTVDTILRNLPSNISAPLQAGIKNVIGLLDREKRPETTHADIVRSGFALTLAAVCYEHISDTNLSTQFSPRLQMWFDDLTHWYPPSDETWSYIPGPGPWSPGEEPPAALMVLLNAISHLPDANTSPWLRPDLICWGWNVMEEEGVRVPVEIEKFCDGIVEASMEEGAIGFLLYCKQY